MTIHFKYHHDQVVLFRKHVQGLCQEVFGKKMDPFHWRYYYRQSIVKACSAWDGEKLVAWYAITRQPLANLPKGWLSLDTMTHPDYRGKGLMVKTATEVFKMLHDSVTEAVVYGFANHNSTPIFLNKLGFYEVGKMYDFHVARVQEFPEVAESQDVYIGMSLSRDDRARDLFPTIHLDYAPLFLKNRFPVDAYKVIADPSLAWSVLQHRDTGIVVDMQCEKSKLYPFVREMPRRIGGRYSIRTVEGSLPFQALEASRKYNKMGTHNTMVCSKEIPAKEWWIFGGAGDTI